MKKLSIILGVVSMLMCFTACDNNRVEEETTETTTSTYFTDNFLVDNDAISSKYSDIFQTWYSANDIIAFTKEGEFYLTYYEGMDYCISGSYTIDDENISILINPNSIRDDNITISENTEYTYTLSNDTLILTLANDKTQSITYYLDKSVALGESN